MKNEDIEKAVLAFRYACPHSTLLKHLDGNKEPYNCWEWKSYEHDFKCNGFICKRLRTFINILKEPEQDSLPDFKEPYNTCRIMNHEIPTTCPNCGHEYDARLHWLVCPKCGHETPKLQTEQTQNHDL